jgi:hypothetical protein
LPQWTQRRSGATAIVVHEQRTSDIFRNVLGPGTTGSFEQGSFAALIIVAVGVLPVVRITRYADGGSRAGSADPR